MISRYEMDQIIYECMSTDFWDFEDGVEWLCKKLPHLPKEACEKFATHCHEIGRMMDEIYCPQVIVNKAEIKRQIKEGTYVTDVLEGCNEEEEKSECVLYADKTHSSEAST